MKSIVGLIVIINAVTSIPQYSQESLSKDLFGYLFFLPSTDFLVGSPRQISYPSLQKSDPVSILDFSFNHDDLYSEEKRGRKLFGFHQDSYRLSFQKSFRFLDRDINAYSEIVNNRIRLSNDDPYTSISFDPIEKSYYQLIFSAGTNIGKVNTGFSVSYSRFDLGNFFKINDFPYSNDDKNLNSYFYSLLQPTFGTELDINNRFENLSLLLDFSLPLGNQIIFGARVKSDIRKYDAGIDYYNSTPKLKGDKTINIPADGNDFIYEFYGNYIRESFLLSLAVSYFNSDHTISITPENPTRKNDIYLDLVDLGNSSLNRRGLSAGLGILFPVGEKMNISVSECFSFSEIEFKGDVSTPVLGFRFLPIAHSFEGIGDGEILVNHLSFKFEHRLNELLNYSINTGLYSPFAELNVSGDAYLEFGIDDVSYSEKIDLSGALYFIEIKPAVAVEENIVLSYSISQLIPDLTIREDDRKIAEERRRKSGIKSDGGRTHKISLSFLF